MTTKFAGAVLSKIGADRPWTDSQPIQVRELELDGPGPGEVLVRMESAGVCHSDLSRVSGVRECVVPMLLGHEGAGIIETLGPDCDGLEIGQKVTMTFMPRCGECEACLAPGWALCSRGMTANALGEMLGGGRRIHMDGVPIDHHGGVSAFAEYAIVDRHSLVVVPKEVPSDVAALLGCAILTGGGAVRNAARLQPGESLAVVGVGGVGLAALLVAQAIGATEVTAIDMLESKLALAVDEYGASAGLTPVEASEQGTQFDAVIECAGNPRALETAIALTKPGGRTVTVGLPHPESVVQFSPLALVTGARSIIGSYMGSGIPEDDIRDYAELYLQGKLPIEKLISGSIALDQVNEAMDTLQEGAVVRQMIDFRR
ncbi:MAG: alcohol dehydrogenase catalytic domain-containing protein [Leucobacter sp.]